MSEVNKDTLVSDLVKSKVFIWTTRSRYFPKVTDSFIEWTKNWQLILKPEKVADSLIAAREKILNAKSNNDNILVVLDKEIFRDDVEKICVESKMLFLNNKIPSWIFTNFDTFSKRIYSMNKLKSFITSASFARLTKKEQLMKKRELDKLEIVYKWVTWLSKLPKLVVVFDAEYNLWVIKELEKIKIDYIAVANTDLSKWLSTESLVVANTNSYESMNYLLNYLLK